MSNINLKWPGDDSKIKYETRFLGRNYKDHWIFFFLFVFSTWALQFLFLFRRICFCFYYYVSAHILKSLLIKCF